MERHIIATLHRSRHASPRFVRSPVRTRRALRGNSRRAVGTALVVRPLGPPSVIPTHEWLGGLQLRRGNAAAAVAAYSRALERRPNRAAALLGLARSQRAAGDRAAAERTYRKLAQQWRSADKGLQIASEARRSSTAGDGRN